nr:ECF transporter S component [Veillonella denticariosi]
MWQNITAPNILSPLFFNPIVSVLPPRVIFPVLAYLVYLLLWKAPPQGPRIIVAAFMGTVFHTIMVMGLIFLLYADMFAFKMNLSPDQVLGTIVVLSVTHGIPEAIFAGVIVTPVALALRKMLRKDTPKKVKADDVNTETVVQENITK